MTRGWKIAVGIVALVVAVNVLLRLLGSFTGGTPGGPNGSSYATARRGVAAYATLLGRTSHVVDQSRDLPHTAKLDPRDTVMVLDPPSVAARDVQALRNFVLLGGRLVAAGNVRGFTHRTIPGPHVAHVRRLTLLTDGRRWKGGSYERTSRLGDGLVIALADSSPL